MTLHTSCRDLDAFFFIRDQNFYKVCFLTEGAPHRPPPPPMNHLPILISVYENDSGNSQLVFAVEFDITAIQQ